MTKLFVGGLDYSINNDQLGQLFQPFGTVSSAEIVSDRFSGQSKGFGFVEMENDDEAQNAISQLDGSEYEGRRLGVSVAKKKEEGERSNRPRFNDRNNNNGFQNRNNDRRPGGGSGFSGNRRMGSGGNFNRNRSSQNNGFGNNRQSGFTSQFGESNSYSDRRPSGGNRFNRNNNGGRSNFNNNRRSNSGNNGGFRRRDNRDY